jgi:Outer membrane lipoprotein-sorting protein
MQSHLTRVLTILLCLVCGRAASAQTADEIIEKHLAALGGRAALAKLTSRQMTGTIVLSTPVGELTGAVETQAARPNKSRSVIKVDLAAIGGAPMTVDQRFDGNTGFVIDTLQGNRDITGSQLELMKANMFPSPLMNYKETGMTVELKGREKVGDRDAYALVITPPASAQSRTPVRFFIDAETYLQSRIVVKVDIPQVGGEVEQTTDFSDYRDVDGFQVPFRIRASSAVQTYTIAFTKVENNPKIDDAVFSKP